MNMKDEKFDEFDIDLETADRIAKEYPSLSDSARERMFNMIENKMTVTNKDDADSYVRIEHKLFHKEKK